MGKKAWIAVAFIFLLACPAATRGAPSEDIKSGPEFFAAGKAAMEHYRLREAIGLFTRAIKGRGLTKRELARAYYNLSKARFYRCEFERSMKEVNRALELNPDYAEAYIARGDIMAKKGEYKKAIDDFTRAMEFEPRSAKAHASRGDVLIRLRDLTAAAADCDRAIELDPELAGAYVVRGLVRWLTPNPDNPRRFNTKSMKKAREDFDKAIEISTKVIKSNPRDALAYFDRGRAFSLNFKHQRALEDFSKVIELVPRYAYAYNARGEEWDSEREYQKAVDDHTRAIEILPGHAPFYFDRGCVLWRMEDYDRSIEDFTRVIELKPKYALAYLKRGAVYTDMGDYLSAVKDLTRAIELEPDALYYSCRGRAYHFMGEYGNAIQDYKRTLEISPNSCGARKYLAWLRATCPDGRYRDGKSAVELARKALELRGWPDEGYQAVLAAAYAEAGRFNDAVNAQLKAIELLEKRLSWKIIPVETRRREASWLPKYKERLESYRAGRPLRDTWVPTLFGP